MFELVDAEKANYPIAVLCDVLEVSRSSFHACKNRPPSARSKADAQLAVEIAAARRKRPFWRTTDSNHASPIAPNVVARDFEPTAPNQVWAGDVTSDRI